MRATLVGPPDARMWTDSGNEVRHIGVAGPYNRITTPSSSPIMPPLETLSCPDQGDQPAFLRG